jgi:hypothetical protein
MRLHRLSESKGMALRRSCGPDYGCCGGLLMHSPMDRRTPSLVLSSENQNPAGPPWIYGRPDARFTLIEYADLECPALPTADQFALRMRSSVRSWSKPLGSVRSIAAVARKHGVNANLLFGWLRLHRRGSLPTNGAHSRRAACEISAGSRTDREPRLGQFNYTGRWTAHRCT